MCTVLTFKPDIRTITGLGLHSWPTGATGAPPNGLSSLSGAGVLHMAGLAITGGLLFTAVTLPDLKERPQDKPVRSRAPHRA